MASCQSSSHSLCKAHLHAIFSQNAGQNCIGIERLIVHRRQFDELHSIFLERVPKIRLGSVLTPTEQGFIMPVECGAMISSNRFDGLELIIKRAQETVGEDEVQVLNGTRYDHVLTQGGCYFNPTVVGPVTNSMEIAQKERKDPIVCSSPASLMWRSLRPGCTVDAL